MDTMTMFTTLTEDQREALRKIVTEWISEGFTTPPYDPAYYDIFEGLGLTDEGGHIYSIDRPIGTDPDE